ncbi:CPBP family intramembrane metalloprotease [Streptococcus didelphis]|uniref:CPBP family intramembrane metalloprotease n=2 Tax=Streptococcus didelphis TaxID=102886 RepID=A0ABY9LIV5_9STRE|nr:CPBP family intramembrane glutamic endopeptidase [Streptococcus didelphis]WMB28735.1 CPBP family intramembrane metalloprotease [Streptococcus didelphis]
MNKNNVQKTFETFLLLLTIYILCMYASQYLVNIFSTFRSGGHIQQALTNVEGSGIGYLLGIPISLACFGIFKNRKKVYYELIHHKKKMTPQIFLFAIAYLLSIEAIAQATTPLMAKSFNIFHLSLFPSIEAVQAGNNGDWLMLLYAGLLGPLSEELIFRFAGLQYFKKYGKTYTIIVTAILFGILQGNLLQSFLAILIGLILGYIALEYSLGWTVILHIFSNFFLNITTEIFNTPFSNSLGGKYLAYVL